MAPMGHFAPLPLPEWNTSPLQCLSPIRYRLGFSIWMSSMLLLRKPTESTQSLEKSPTGTSVNLFLGAAHTFS